MDMMNTADRVQDMEHGMGIYMREIIFVFLIFGF